MSWAGATDDAFGLIGPSSSKAVVVGATLVRRAAVVTVVATVVTVVVGADRARDVLDAQPVPTTNAMTNDLEIERRTWKGSSTHA